MLSDILALGITFIHVIGLLCILWGVFSIIAGVLGGQGASGLVKGALLMGLGTYITGLGQIL